MFALFTCHLSMSKNPECMTAHCELAKIAGGE